MAHTQPTRPAGTMRVKLLFPHNDLAQSRRGINNESHACMACAALNGSSDAGDACDNVRRCVWDFLPATSFARVMDKVIIKHWPPPLPTCCQRWRGGGVGDMLRFFGVVGKPLNDAGINETAGNQLLMLCSKV